MWEINTLKKFILLAFAALSIISCRKDEENEEIQPSFVGTWKWTKTLILSGKDNLVISSTPILNSECSSKNQYIFTDDQKFDFTHFASVNNVCEQSARFSGEYSYDEYKKLLTATQYINLTYIPLSYYLNSFTINEIQIISEEKSDYNNDGINDKLITVLTK